MQTSVPPGELFTLDTLLAHLVEHRRRFPHHAGYQIEIRDHLLAAPPQHATHDEEDAVVILVGVQHR